MLLLVLIIILVKIVVDYTWNFSISRIVCKVFSYDLFVQSSAPKKFFMKIRYKTNKNNYESLRFRWVICLFYWKENLKKSTRLWKVKKLSFFFYKSDTIKNILRSKNIPNDLVIYYFEVIIFCYSESVVKKILKLGWKHFTCILEPLVLIVLDGA